MRYYKCVDCGYRGDFGFYRAKNIKCGFCKYDMLVEYEKEEYQEWAGKFKKHQDENVFYKSKGKLNAFGKPIEKEDKNGKD